MPENKFDVLNGAMETVEEVESLKSLLVNPSNEESLLNKYNPDNILKSKQVANINAEQILEKTSLVEVKETSIFTKFLNFIKESIEKVV